ncbi:flagellar assembly protein FliX [Roseicella aquatilis]|uniref:Flagellar assembly regulator FliX n=1 Tax=Roseicella aquatilis TaxID=2527868 RepID=A0A4R4DCT6_9PROT|nr:flagellar assembly protein FliX [Roseicella aquatilis]TCZ57973.1 hypothetical protein EXY23_17485 [Roseicella aquatilis]
MSWVPFISGPQATAQGTAVGRSRPGTGRFLLPEGEEDPKVEVASATALGGVALLQLQTDSAPPRRDRIAEAGAALGDLSRLQLAMLRGADLSTDDMEGLATRAEALACDGSHLAAAIALRLRVELARQRARP